MGAETRKPTYQELLEENRLLRAEVEALKDALRQARQQIEKLQRTSKRQAAPFRRRQDKKKPDHNKRSPGRKPGHQASFRKRPDHVDIERVVPLKQCPQCGGEVEDVRPVEQFIEDIPPVPVRVTRLITHSGWCPECGQRVRSTDPEQVSGATGSAGVHLGRRALGLLAYSKYVLGLTYRKISDLMKVFGLKITPGGIVGALRRAAVSMVGSWLEIWKEIRAGPLACADETSWYVGEPGWWLWVFCRPGWTLYSVQRSRGSDVVNQTLGRYEGVLVSDCLSSYDPPQYAKQKCYSHHLKALSEAIERLPSESGPPLGELKLMLQTAMALGKARQRMPAEKFLERRSHLERWADNILEDSYNLPGVQKTLERFRRHREDLFTFLYEPGVPATNNLAERQLRPAVIARKLSCGNKTERGRQTWQMLASIAATCRQRGRSFIEHVAESMPLTASPPSLKAA